MAGASGDDPKPEGTRGYLGEWFDELEVLTAIATALDPLPPDARARVIAWVVAKFGPPRQSGYSDTNNPAPVPDGEPSGQ
jgi:hypothetical protein